MPRKSSGNAKETAIRVWGEDKTDLSLLKRAWWGKRKDKHQGDVVHELLRMLKEKKISDPSFRISPFETKSHSDTPNKAVETLLKIQHKQAIDISIMSDQFLEPVMEVVAK
jgi:hypothetical protein